MSRREISTPHVERSIARREDGLALIIATMAMLLMSVLAAALVLASSSEMITAASFRDSSETLYAADAALEHAINTVAAASDWSLLLSGSIQAAFTDGPPYGARSLDGSSIDLDELRNMANCSKRTACSADDMNRVTRERPRAADNPRWQLYSYGNLASVMPAGSIGSPQYVVVMIADDASENDGNPTVDGITPCHREVPSITGNPPVVSCNPGSGVIALRSHAFGPRGARRIVEATLARLTWPSSAPGATDPPALPITQPETDPSSSAAGGEPQGYNEGRMAVRILSWREVR